MRFWAELTASATRPDHPAHAYVAERYDQARTLMEAHFRHRAADGDLAEPDRPITATIPTAMAAGRA